MDQQKAPDFFTRKSSGLVRVVGGFDTFIFAFGLISIGSFVYSDFYFQTYYPGSNHYLSVLFVFLGTLFVVGTFYLWSVTFPRSGGDYVFLSRTTNAGVAFTLSFFQVVAFCFFAAINTVFIVQVGISPLLGTLAIITESSGLEDAAAWSATENGTFLIGAPILLITGLVPAFGMRKFLVFQRVMFVVAMAGILLGLIVLLLLSRESFDSSFSSATGLTRDGVLRAAEESGFTLDASFSWKETIRFMAWPALFLTPAVMAAAIAGEIKSIRRSQFIGMFGAIAVATVFMLAYIPLAEGVFGRDFMQALVWNSTEAPEFSTTAPPFITLLLGLSTNIVFAVVIIVGFVAWSYFLITPQMVYSQRLLIAWSFDGLAPEKLGYVSERFRSPIVAIVVTIVVALVMFAALAYGVFALFAFALVAYAIWGVICVAGIFFPSRRPTLYGASPASGYRVMGLPLMTAISIPAALFFALLVYLFWDDPLVAGHATATLVASGVTLAAGVVTYLIVRAVRKSQGVQLDQVFKELPIE